jgi:hypothetical protein
MNKRLDGVEGRLGELKGYAEGRFDELEEYVDVRIERLGDVELRHLWGRANNLHQNFYENWMPPEEVEAALGGCKGLR